MPGITVNVATKDLATPAVRRISTALSGDGAKKVIGRSARNTLRSHFFELNSSRPNQMGGPRTNFYTQVGRSVQTPVVQGGGVSISINQVGLRQRFYGGTILPQKGKYLTIPADVSAYGKRAREFSDLHAIFFRSGAGALITKAGQTMFWLARKAVQKPDPSVLPTADALLAPAVQDLRSYLERQILKAES
jgi:hypothetical protein